MATEPIGAGAASTGRSSHNPVLGAAAVLVGAFLVSFDQRLFAIGLPDLRGAFGLTFDEGTWLATIALAPQLLVAPAIPWLATVLGVRRVLVVPGLVYIALSLAIPFVSDYQVLLTLHFVHGLLLGIFIPVTIMIVLHNLPMRWWIVGLAMYSFRLSFTGNSGVSLVGFHVQHLGWEWIYWQNAIVAVLMILLTWLGTPREGVNRRLLASADWGGMLMLGGGLALIYAGLDQGNRLDWFESGIVTSLLVGGGVLVVGFLINEAVVREPWAHPSVLMSRNIGLAMLALMAYMVTSLSNMMLVPTFLTVVGHLRPEQVGDVLLNCTALPLVGVVTAAVLLLRRFDARLVILGGLTCFAVAGWMGTGITPEWSPDDFVPMALMQSLGQGLTFTGLLVFVVSNANPARTVALVAYIQVMRLDIIEITTTVMSTWLRVREQVHSNLIGLHVSVGDSEVVQALDHLKARFIEHSAAAETAVARATSTLASLVRRQADVLSFIDGFEVTFWAAIAGILLVSLMRTAPPGPLTPAAPKPAPAVGRSRPASTYPKV
ncbi:MFS transporter [Vineibacter terrae]|uniref:MFS transporter n=1 Tax=Vineibacter terrae TaxID=2586908 RepID=A0A5C8PCR4_9HYPH|nr:MFS transporter [Vineibacter terrae]TXL71380.1 MFS transporter [Vineibacter terrae]